MKKSLKRILLTLPGFEALCRRLSREHIRVIYYHRFSEAPDPARRRLDRRTLRDQLALITRHHPLWNPDQQVDSWITGRVDAPCPVIITVDDGYHDLYEVAFPLFRQFGAMPTVFAAAGFMEGSMWYWWDQLRSVLEDARGRRVQLEVQDQQLDCDLTTPRGIERAWSQIADVLVLGRPDDIGRELLRMAQTLGVTLRAEPPADYRPVTLDQLREMEAAGVQFGAHTVTHPVLSRISPARIRDEVYGGRKYIQECFRNQVDVFCYPHGGKNDTTPETHRIVREAGFRAAYLAITPAPDPRDRYGLPRYSAFVNLLEFRWRLCGAQWLLEKQKARRRKLPAPAPGGLPVTPSLRDAPPSLSTGSVSAEAAAVVAENPAPVIQVSRPVSRVGVVITCYNYGRFLTECVESVLAQTYRDWEVVIVDDGSSDDTPAVARQWDGDRRVRYVRQSNQGQAAAKNRGVRECRTELIAYLDGDDYWMPDKLTRQIPLFENPRVGVVVCEGEFVDDHGRSLPQPPRSEYRQLRRGQVTRHLIFDNYVPFSSTVVRRACLEEVGGFKEHLPMAIDWDLWLRISVNWEFDFLDETLLRVRSGHQDQMSRNLRVRQRCCDQIMAEFVRDYPDAIGKRDLRLARAYTHAVRGWYFEEHNRLLALWRYLRSALTLPWQWTPYRGMVRTLFPFLKSVHRRISGQRV